MPNPIIETERLDLCEWRSEDWTEFRPIATDSDVVKYITGGAPWPDERIQDFVRRQVEGQLRRGFSMWQLRPKTDGRLIGFCGLQPWRGWEDIEIGWWLAKDCWGQGLATEAARAALAYGFETAKLDRIIAVVHVDNLASQRVAEKLGMERERTAVCEGFDVLVYSTAKPA